jgi:hypothetical protein
MMSSEKEENSTLSTVSGKPKDRGVNLSKDILDRNEGSKNDPSFDLNAYCYSEKLTKSIWELEKSNEKHTFTGMSLLYCIKFVLCKVLACPINLGWVKNFKICQCKLLYT